MSRIKQTGGAQQTDQGKRRNNQETAGRAAKRKGTFYRENDYRELGGCIEQAIDRCIEEDVLRRFLIDHRLEVVKVVQLDYTFDRQIELERIDSREEGYAEGRIEGHAKGRQEGEALKTIRLIGKKVNKKKSLEQIASELEENPEDIRLMYEIVCSNAPEYNVDRIYQTYLKRTQEKGSKERINL